MRSAVGHTFAVATFCAVSVPGAAQTGLILEFDGAIHVFVPQMEGARSGFTRFPALDAVSIEGVDDLARMVLEFALPPGARTGDAPLDARISFRPDGFRDYWVSPPKFPEDAVTIDHLDLSGPSPRIAGHFRVPFCFTPTPIHPPDLSYCLPASGRFDSALVRY